MILPILKNSFILSTSTTAEEKRKRYISRRREEMSFFGQDAYSFFSVLLNADTYQVSYSRDIKEDFGIDI